MVEIAKIAVARLPGSALSKMAPTKPPAPLTASTSVAANRKASSRTQPPIAE